MFKTCSRKVIARLESGKSKPPMSVGLRALYVLPEPGRKGHQENPRDRPQGIQALGLAGEEPGNLPFLAVSTAPSLLGEGIEERQAVGAERLQGQRWRAPGLGRWHALLA